MTTKKHDCLTCTGYGAGCDGSEPCALDILDDDSTGHTPGKLVREGHHGCDSIHAIQDDGTAIEICYMSGLGNDDENEANAARLALCWNSHDELVAARDSLKTLLTAKPITLDYSRIEDVYTIHLTGEQLAIARAALANAPLSDSDS